MYLKIFCIFLIIFNLCEDLFCDTDNRIIGGRPADLGEIPFQVSLRKTYNDEHFCGGVLVTPRHVLVAAHCMFYNWGGVLTPYVVSVVAGQLTLPITRNTVYRNATIVTVHPFYDSNTMGNDIAVIEVSKPFPVNTNPLVKTIPMTNASINSGTCYVSGWGVEKYGSKFVSPILLVTEVDIVKFNKCEQMYTPNVTLVEGMLCAGHINGTTDACKGDSGGPLVCNGLLTGIVSTGSGCGSAKYPGIYTNISHYRTWIDDIINTSSSQDYYYYQNSDNKVSSNSFVQYLINKTLSRSNSSKRIFNINLLEFSILICISFNKLFL